MELVQDTSCQYSHLMHTIYGSIKSQALTAACKLGIFDALSTMHRSCGVDLSTKLSTNKDATVQLLDTLVSLQLLQKQLEDGVPFYCNTSTAEMYLVSSSPNCLTSFILHMDKFSKVYDNLHWAVREGHNQWQRAFGHSESSLSRPFDPVYSTQKDQIEFLNAMRSSLKQDVEKCAAAFDLSEFNHMCDLGGCTGDFAFAACQLYPNMEITVFDLPSVVELSPHFRPSCLQCPNERNVKFIAGDFFRDPLPSADLYVLVRILHDWDEEKINQLVKTTFQRLPSGGGILICEKLLNDDKTGPLINCLRSLTMLSAVGPGARERSGAEYRNLLESHGFVQVQTKDTQGFFLDAVLAKKP